jgi:hypothetical protein
MRLVPLLAALSLLLSSIVASAEQCCENCCCSSLIEGGITGKFAMGCYTGNATDDRLIPLGFEAGSGWVLEKTTSEPGQCASYKTEAMGAADYSCSLNNCDPGTGKCAANRLQEFTPESFEIGTVSDVNRNAANFCWYMWEKKSGYHDTLQYTGDGSNPRNLTLNFTPDVIMIMNETGTVTTVLKTKDMPATTSCRWDSGNAEGACHTNGITAFISNGVTINSGVNASSVVYNVMYWKDYSGYLRTGSYVGDGNSGGGGNALVADTQVITVTDCDVSYVMIAGQTASGLDFECDKQRGVNIGTSVVGPGNINQEPYGQKQSSVDEESGIQDLTDGSFTVTGAPALETSCNDLGITYYYWAMCAQPSLPGSVNAVDWSNSMIATWNLEQFELSGLTENEAASCQDCGLTNVNTVTVDSGDSLIATDSLLFDITNDTSLTCDLTTECEEINFAGDVSWGCFAKSVQDAANAFLGGHGDRSFDFHRLAASDTLRCAVGENASTVQTADADANEWPDATWVHMACTFNDTSNAILPYANANQTGSGTQANTRSSDGSGNFVLGELASAGTLNFEGNMNECAVDNMVWSASDICRICSCNIDGRACACFAADPTLWVSQGRRDSLCGGCTLPANCNIGQPAG